MKTTVVLALALAASGAQAAEQAPAPAAASRLGAGFLKPGEGPDSGKLLPPPPAEGSKALKRDRKGEAQALKLQGTARWEQAKIDADIFTPKAVDVMSCAAWRVLGPETTPLTNALLRKAGADLGLSSYPAKNLYKRPRPFLGNGKPVCTPDMSGLLAKDGSYPSGHAALGYGWAMILASIMPERRKALLKRGAAFADSRRVCNVHFLSDIAAGEMLAKAVVDRLNQNVEFAASAAAAATELAKLPPRQTRLQA